MSSEKGCKKCILPAGYPDIEFDESGTCNYCNYFEKIKNELNDFDKHKKILDDRIELHRGKGERFDVLAGLSGGKDSTYVLYYLKKRYNLRVLAYTYDNNFLTDYAHSNIKIALDALEIPHFYHRKNWKYIKSLYRKSVEKMGYICYACALPAYWSTIVLAADLGIPMVVGGRSRPQIFHSLLPGGNDFAIPSIWQNLKPYDRPGHVNTFGKFYDTIKLLVHYLYDNNQQEIDEIMTWVFPFPEESSLRNNILPEYLNLFLYIPYDEKRFMNELEQDIGWKRPPMDHILTHADCGVHDAADYMYYMYYGRLKIIRELAVMIREGKITREEALKRAEKEIKEPVEELDGLLNVLDMNRNDIPHLCGN